MNKYIIFKSTIYNLNNVKFIERITDDDTDSLAFDGYIENCSTEAEINQAFQKIINFIKSDDRVLSL